MTALSSRRLLAGLFVLCLPALAAAQDAPLLFDATEWREGDLPDTDGDGYPDNAPSVCYQCLSTHEWGDRIGLDFAATGGSGLAGRFVVTMSSWTAHSDWIDEYPDPDGYVHPMTLTLYEVDDSGAEPAAGDVIAQVTQEALIPWRPEDTENCPDDPTFGYGWGEGCTFGYLFDLVFELSDSSVDLPSELVWGLSTNTQTWGYEPIGAPGPYNSLNVALVNLDWNGDGITDENPNPAVGSNPDVEVFWASNYPCCGQDGTFKISNVLNAYGGTTHAVRIEAALTVVRIDVRPGQADNKVNSNAKQLVPIAILSDDGFDATTLVDPESVRVRGAAPISTRQDFDDVDGDGLEDLVLYFRARSFAKPTESECGDAEAKLELQGVEYSGAPLGGVDSVTWLGPDCNF